MLRSPDLETFRFDTLSDRDGSYCDDLLLPYLHAADEKEAQQQLTRLIEEHARPLVDAIVTRRWRRALRRPGRLHQSEVEQDAEDIRGEVIAQLIARLAAARMDAGREAIGQFAAYVAVTTYHACDRSLRRSNALPMEEPAASGGEGTGATGPSPSPNEVDPLDRVADPTADVAAEVERREYLRRLWSGIERLPRRHCAALLLNLRDDRGRGVLALLPLMGIATVREIAALLGSSEAALAAIWDQLPLDDAAIARRLGTTRREVISLRKVARGRLARWMGRMG
jgi:hypothetical protein